MSLTCSSSSPARFLKALMPRSTPLAASIPGGAGEAGREADGTLSTPLLPSLPTLPGAPGNLPSLLPITAQHSPAAPLAALHQPQTRSLADSCQPPPPGGQARWPASNYSQSWRQNVMALSNTGAFSVDGGGLRAVLARPSGDRGESGVTGGRTVWRSLHTTSRDLWPTGR